MIARNVLLTSAVVVVCSVSPCTRAFAYSADLSTAYTSSASVRVVVHANMQNSLTHVDGTTPWTRAEVLAAVQWSLARINAVNGPDIPYLWLDTAGGNTCDWHTLTANCNLADPTQTNPLSDISRIHNCDIANTIDIIPSNCVSTQIFHTRDETGSVIVFQANDASIGAARYDNFTDAGGEVFGHWIFEQNVVHEIGHALGLWHPDSGSGASSGPTICPNPSLPGCSVMEGVYGQANEAFTVDDLNGLRVLWGSRSSPGHRDFETVGTTTAELPLASIAVTGPTNAASMAPTGVAGTDITFAGYYPTAAVPHVFVWDYNTLAVTDIGTTSFTASTGFLGVAQTQSTRYVAQFVPRMSSDGRRWTRRIWLGRHPVASGNWTTSYATDPAAQTLAGDTAVAGVSTAFDQRSGRLLYAYRATDGTVLLQGTSITGTEPSTVINTGLPSMSQPSIACAGSELSRNCVLVVVDPGRPRSTNTNFPLQLLEFGWSQTGTTATWTPGLVFPTLNSVRSNPVVTATRTSTGSYEFNIAYSFALVLSGQLTNEIVLLRYVPVTQAFSLVGILGTESSALPFLAGGSLTGNLETFSFAGPRTP